MKEPKNVVGVDIRVYRTDLSKEARRIDRTGNRLHGLTHKLPHIKGDVIWALDQKTKLDIMIGQWRQKLQDISLQELLKLFKKTFLPTRNVFHRRAQFFKIGQEGNETQDEYRKKLVDIERKCEFNSITPDISSHINLERPQTTKKPVTNS